MPRECPGLPFRPSERRSIDLQRFKLTACEYRYDVLGEHPLFNHISETAAWTWHPTLGATVHCRRSDLAHTRKNRASQPEQGETAENLYLITTLPTEIGGSHFSETTLPAQLRRQPKVGGPRRRL